MKKNNQSVLSYMKSMLAMVLCFAMSVSMMYQPIYALDTNNGSHQTVNTTAEDFEKEYVKHFNMSDGTTQAVVYETQIHELDENGVYQEIDNTLSDNGNELENIVEMISLG